MEKVYIIKNKHDDCVLSLYQSCVRKGLQPIPMQVNSQETYEELVSSINKDDYVMLIHIGNDSSVLPQLANDIEPRCKRLLNAEAYKIPVLAHKYFQQNIVSQQHPEICIETFRIDAYPGPYPGIAKPAGGSCGEGIFMINSKEDVASVEEPRMFVSQRYIKNDGDWRVICIGGKAVSAIKRLQNKNHITNNIATGSYVLHETNPEILKEIYSVAEKAANSLRFDYVGIDVIYDIENKKYHFLESNERATFETTQIITGINISDLIIEELIREKHEETV